ASVAVIGASRDAAKIGGLPIAFMRANGFAGEIYPVNPGSAEIQGLPAFASVKEVPGPVDLAIIAVPSAGVPAALRDCAAKGVRAAVVFSSGFAEVSEEGRLQQAEIAALARRSGMRVVGPNCMGVVDFRSRAVASFHPAYREGIGPAGRIALVSQSGAFSGLCFMMAQDRGLAFSASASTGNEADVDVADCLAHFAADPGTDVILLYLEGCRDGRKLMEGLRRARAAQKPVICLKPGATEAGAAAVAAHTASPAGSEAVFAAVLRQMGVYRAHSLEEFFDIGAAAAAGVLPQDGRVGLVTVSGGIGVLMADTAERLGLAVAPAPAPLQAKIRALVPFAATRNPIDITGHVVADRSLIDRSLDLVLEEGGYGSVIASLGATGRNPVYGPRMLETAAALRERHPKTLLCISCLSTLEFRKSLQATGVLSFEEPVHAVRAVAALAAFRRSFDAPEPAEEDSSPAAPIRLPAAVRIGGLETIIDLLEDPAFGPMISLRFGGVLGEALGGAVLRAAPIVPAEARAMIEELPGRAALAKAPKAEIAALAQTLVRASRSTG
ncbi:MAG TPA: CoA-binding protein, partial [Stellaceae bacterium]|nr:CoA-binding protein [Stellaceae bacterium]